MPSLVTVEEAARWCGIPEPVDDDLEQFLAVIHAVEAHVIRTYTLPREVDPLDSTVPGDIVVTPDITQAVCMQVARLRKRHDTPEGLASFDDFALRVSRLDPDIDALLTPYSFGFA